VQDPREAKNIHRVVGGLNLTQGMLHTLCGVRERERERRKSSREGSREKRAQWVSSRRARERPIDGTIK
jgi:hypothetical protein